MKTGTKFAAKRNPIGIGLDLGSFVFGYENPIDKGIDKGIDKVCDLFEEGNGRFRTFPRGPGGCNAGGSGWQNPGSLDSAHGNRATLFEAGITRADLRTGSGTDVRKVMPPRYRWTGRTARHHGLTSRENINACHLLSDVLGGSGLDLRNLATCSRGANTVQDGSTQGANNMYTYETQVKNAIEKEGQTVYCKVTANYQGVRAVATEFHIFAIDYLPDGSPGLKIDRTVPNELISGRNLGTYLDPTAGQPVPIAGMN
ncbi:DNA/RNA non-specific endonuclease [Streptomyces sp. NPDC052773]|uniref:DNA/RNA non-specific endonuclease n=1 Tax=Streptomyces sp. NPDC052773 TaxID=3365693 RepID=UPI0037D75A37